MHLKAVIVVLVALAACGHGARILGVFPVVSHSHYIGAYKLFKALAARGHDVTLVSPYKDKAPSKNFRDVVLDGFTEVHSQMEKEIDIFAYHKMPTAMKLIFMYGMGFVVSEKTFENEAFKNIYKSKEKFDLIITEPFIIDPIRVMGHIFQAKTILLSSFGSSSLSNHLVGNPAPLSYVPDFILDHSGPMNFCLRFQNLFYDIFHKALRYLYVDPKSNVMVQKYFPSAPAVSKFNTSLILLNSHPSVTAPAPHAPNMIEIGGFHLDEPKKLPEDLQKYLDEAKEGVIYFSMGSIAKSTKMPVEKRGIFAKVFAQLKLKVLWKYEGDVMEGKPDNVRIGKWMPQQDIIAHPNVKLFISHGGLLSTIEAIYHGKPTIGLPVFAEQFMNVKHSVYSGFSLMIPFSELTEEKLTDAINEMIKNPSYTTTAKKRAAIMRDQPMKPLDSAVYWTEFVLKHDGAEHLKSLGLKQSWIESTMIDVYIVLCLAVTLVVGAFVMLFKCVCGKKNKATTEKNKETKKKTN